MTKNKERLLNKILNQLEDDYKLKLRGHWTRNSHWSEAVCQIPDMNNFANSINDYAEKYAKYYIPQKLKPDEDRLKDDIYKNRRLRITITRHEDNPDKIYIDSNEVFIERLLTFIANNCQNGGSACLKYWNQYQVGKSYKEAIDIRIKDGNKFKYVELKALDTPQDGKEPKADNPLFAIIESVKNYHLSTNKDNISELIILAPNDYWSKYFADKNVYLAIKKLISEFANFDIKIKLQNIGCTCDYLQKFLKEIKKIIKDSDFKLTKSKVKDNSKRRYTHAASYELYKIYSCLSNYELESLFKIRDYEL